MTSYAIPIKNGASGWIGYVTLSPLTATGAFQANPTLAAGDVKISIDGGAFANLGTLPTVTPASGKGVKITLSQAETNGDNLLIIFSDQTSPPEWCDLGVELQTAARGIDDLAFPTVTGRSLDVTATGAAGIDWGNLENPSTSNNLSATTTNLVNTATTVTNQLTAAAIATGVWQDATAGDFTAASSIGKALYVANVVPGAAGGHFIAGTNAATTITTALTTTFTGNLTGSVGSVTGAVGSVTGAVGSVTGNVGGNVTGTVASVVGNVGGNVTGTVASVVGNVGGNVTGSVGSVVARVTANTDQLAGQTVTAAAGVTFPTSVASPTNITAGTITTVTNLTNAPTNGDLTATMKTSVTTAATAATPTAAAVTGNVGGNVTGTVGGMTAAGLAGFFTTDTTKTYADAVAGSVVYEIAVNSGGTGGDPWATALPGAYGAGTAGNIVGNNLDAAITSRMASYTQPTGFLAATFPSGTIANTTNITAGTVTTVSGNVNGSVASVTNPVALTSAYDFAKGTVAMTESYAANGVAPTPVQALMAIHQDSMDFAITGTSYTVKKLDNATTAFVKTLNDATSPTAAART